MRWNSADPPGNSADPPGNMKKEKENATERLAFSFFIFPVTKFALENRVHWLCEQPCANRSGPRVPFSLSSGIGFALENRIHWLCGQPCANPSPHAGPRVACKSLAQKKESSDFKIEIAAPFLWGLIDRIHFLYGFIRCETPVAMLSSCEGSLPGLHMRTGTALPFP